MKDIEFDIDNKDISLQANTPQLTKYDVIWGTLLGTDNVATCAYMNIVYTGEDTVFNKGSLFCVNATYYPSTLPIVFRIVRKTGNTYTSLYTGNLVFFKDIDKNTTNISACKLPLIDINGSFIIKCYTNAYLFSSNYNDVSSTSNINQEARFLSLCSPGDLFRYPLTGLDIWKYINSIPEYTDLGESILSQFQADNKQVVSAEFDNTVGGLDLELTDSSVSNTLDLEDSLDTSVIKMDIWKFASDESSIITTIDSYRIGCIDKTVAEFANLTAAQLIGASEQYVFSNTGSFTSEKTCFFIMLPTGIDFVNITFTSDNIPSVVYEDDLNASHDSVTINGITYNIYCYHMHDVDSSYPQTFNYELSK